MARTLSRFLALAALVAAIGLAFRFLRHGTAATAARIASPPTLAAGAPQPTGWVVGELRPNGLRIIPAEPSDASRVLSPDRYAGRTRHSYWIATQIPEVLNQLYCWCGCENRGTHRSNLACFEDRMGENCDVCQGTAEIAYRMVQRGITDAGQIQTAVDAKWGRT